MKEDAGLWLAALTETNQLTALAVEKAAQERGISSLEFVMMKRHAFIIKPEDIRLPLEVGHAD